MGGIRWTDDDLRAAVIEAHSWREVLRLLGLRSQSGGSIRVVRQNAERLGLDITHFTGTRQWSDDQLRHAITDSHSWKQVASSLGLSDDPRTLLRIRGHAVRIALDTDHLDPPSRPAPSIDAYLPPLLDELRKAAPALVSAWFTLRGMPVAVPAEPERYDLLVTMADGIQRVQVKSTTSRSPNGRWQVGLGHRPYSLDKTAGKMPYDPNNLDYYAIINGEGGIYLIPISAVAGRTHIYLSAYEKYMVGDVSRLLR